MVNIVNKNDSIVRRVLWNTYNKRCFYCNEVLLFNNFQVDHVIPESLGKEKAIKLYDLGGEFEINSYYNLVPTCFPCNNKKRDKKFDKKHILYYMNIIRAKITEINFLEKKIENLDKKSELSAIISTSMKDISINEFLNILLKQKIPKNQERMLREASYKSVQFDIEKEFILPNKFDIQYYLYIDFEEIKRIFGGSKLTLIFQKLKIINEFQEKLKFSESVQLVDEIIEIIQEVIEKINEDDYLELHDLHTFSDYFFYRRLNLLINLKQYKEFSDEKGTIMADLISISVLIDELIEKRKYNIARNLLINDNFLEYQFIENLSYNLEDKINSFRIKGDCLSAFNLIRKYLKFKDLPEFYLWLIDILLWNNNIKEALFFTEIASNKYPEYPVDIIFTKNNKVESRYTQKFLRKSFLVKLFMKGDEENQELKKEKDCGYYFLVYKARILWILNDIKGALKILDGMIQKNPRNIQAYHLKALISLSLKKLDIAFDCMNKSIILEPKNHFSHWIIANYYILNSNYQNALNSIDNAIQLDKKTPIYYDLKSLVLSSLNKNNYAMIFLISAINKFPGYFKLIETRTIILNEMKTKLDDSLLKSNEEELINEQIQVFFNTVKFDEALNLLKTQIRERPNDSILKCLRALILAEMNCFSESLKCIDNAILLNDNDELNTIKVKILQNYSQKLAIDGNKKEALVNIKKAIKINSQFNGKSYETYGNILILFNEFEQAISKLKKASQFPHPSLDLYLNLGKCHYELDNFKIALNYFNIAKYKSENFMKNNEKSEFCDFTDINSIKESSLTWIMKIEKLLSQ